MKRAYLLPNLFTSASLFCGVLALISVFKGNLTSAYWLILLGVVLDSLDGKIARLTKTQSVFGLNYDSLSDLVVFGVAPAMLTFTFLTSQGVKENIAAGVVSLYVVCGALRLARFNVMALRRPRYTFVGLPIPAAAGVLIVTFSVFQRLNPVFTIKVFPLVVVAMAYLMVSRVSYPSAKNIHLDPAEIVLLVMSGMLVFLVLRPFKELLIFAGFWSYVTFGVVQHIVSFATGLRRVGEETEEEKIEEESKT